MPHEPLNGRLCKAYSRLAACVRPGTPRVSTGTLAVLMLLVEPQQPNVKHKPLLWLKSGIDLEHVKLSPALHTVL